MQTNRMVTLVLALALLAFGAVEAAACHVVRVTLRESGTGRARVYEYTPDRVVRATSPATEQAAAATAQRTLGSEEHGAIWASVQSFSGYLGRTVGTPEGSPVAVVLTWDNGQQANIFWPASGPHEDPRAEQLLQRLLGSRPVLE